MRGRRFVGPVKGGYIMENKTVYGAIDNKKKCQCIYGIEVTSTEMSFSYYPSLTGMRFVYCPMCGKKLEFPEGY